MKSSSWIAVLLAAISLSLALLVNVLTASGVEAIIHLLPGAELVLVVTSVVVAGFGALVAARQKRVADSRAQNRFIFIAHPAESREAALHVGQLLSRHGYGVWLSQEELHPGDDFSVETDDAIARSTAAVVLLTKQRDMPSSFRLEIDHLRRTVRTEDPDASAIVPILEDGAHLPQSLRGIPYYRLGDPDLESRLLAHFGRVFGRT